MQIHSVGIDLGKTTFHLVALSAAGKVLLRKKFTQKQLITFTANMQTSLIGMEACSGAHFLGWALRAQGHDVKLIPAQFVKREQDVGMLLVCPRRRHKLTQQESRALISGAFLPVSSYGLSPLPTSRSYLAIAFCTGRLPPRETLGHSSSLASLSPSRPSWAERCRWCSVWSISCGK
jgi:hypothetical protein